MATPPFVLLYGYLYGLCVSLYFYYLVIYLRFNGLYLHFITIIQQYGYKRLKRQEIGLK